MAQSEWVRWGGLAAMGAGALAILYFLLSLAAGKGDEPGPLDILVILAMLLEVVGLLGFHALQGRNYGRIGRAGLYTSIGSLVIFEFSLACEPGGGRCGSRLARSRRGVGLVGWAGAVWRSYSASEGFAALVRDIVHHIYAGRDTLRGLTAYMGRSRLVSAWVRALVAQR